MSTTVQEVDAKTSAIDTLVKEIENVSAGRISVINILEVCLNAMKLVESFPNLKGIEKKNMVIKAFDIVMTKTGSDPILINLLSSFIDGVINVEKGNIKIRLDPESTVKCCLGICASKK